MSAFFYFGILNGSSRPRPLFARCPALPLVRSAYFYFFSLSKKNTSKFQNETNENKNQVVKLFLFLFHTHDIVEIHEHKACWPG